MTRLVSVCPECGSTSWWQAENYHATDHNYMDWDENRLQYNFTFELKATSDHERENWFCNNGHEAPEDISDALDDAV